MAQIGSKSNELADSSHLAALASGLEMIGPLQALALALALSVAGNLALGWAWLHQRDKATVAVAALSGAVADAKACTDAVRALSVIADQRVKESAAARTAATKAAGQMRQRADRTLSTAPAVPGDMCASMQVLGDDWLKERQ